MQERDFDDIADWIVSYLSRLLDIPPQQIALDVPFERYGLDSTAAAGLTGDLSDWLGRPIDPAVIFDYSTVQALAGWLSKGK